MSARPAYPDWPRGMPLPLAAAYVGLSVTTVHNERVAGRFPAPVPLTAGRHVYLRDDLDRYLDRKAGRTQPSDADTDPFIGCLGG